MKILRYTSEYHDAWNQFVVESRNATFLLNRDYMDYHANRFPDHSLIILSDKNTIAALFPATEDVAAHIVSSHAGLTYGGLILAPRTKATDVGAYLTAICQYYKAANFKLLRYKPIPYIYHRVPTQEDLYWLFRLNARLIKRTLSTTLQCDEPLALTKLRKRKIQEARRANLQVVLRDVEGLSRFWTLLSAELKTHHQTTPTHSLQEISLLQSRFPNNIWLASCYGANELLAGCLIYDTAVCRHLQYISTSPLGRKNGALDLLVFNLMEDARAKGVRFFDFGISTEQNGLFLNQGLIHYKEGFGGRGVCYDEYEISL